MLKKGIIAFLCILILASSVNAFWVKINSPDHTGTDSYIISGKQLTVKAESHYTTDRISSLSINCPTKGGYKTLISSEDYDPPSKNIELPLDTTGFYGDCELHLTVSVVEVDGVAYQDTSEIHLHPGILHPMPGSDLYNQPAILARAMDEVVFSGELVKIPIFIKPQDSFTGMIITETLPYELTYENWAPPKSYSFDYDAGTNELKILIMDAEEIEDQVVWYTVRVSQDAEPGKIVEISGMAEVIGEEFEVSGNYSTKIGGWSVPQCPIDNQQMLGYIEQWADLELGENKGENDEAIMQIIEVWANC